MPLTDTSVALTVKGTLTNSLDLKTVTAALNFGRSISLANGTGAGQADKMWDDTRTIAASTSDDLDLAGVLADAFGALVTFVKVKALIVAAAAGNTNNVVIGNHPTAGFLGPLGAAAHTIAVPPGQLFAVTFGTSGWTVTPTTADILRITNGGAGTSVDYSIVIIGTSA